MDGPSYNDPPAANLSRRANKGSAKLHGGGGDIGKGSRQWTIEIGRGHGQGNVVRIARGICQAKKGGRSEDDGLADGNGRR